MAIFKGSFVPDPSSSAIKMADLVQMQQTATQYGPISYGSWPVTTSPSPQQNSMPTKYKKGQIVIIADEAALLKNPYGVNPGMIDLCGMTAVITGAGQSYGGHEYKIDLDGGKNSWTVECFSPELLKPKQKVTMDSVIISKDKIEQIRAAISQRENTDLIFQEWGFDEVFEKGTGITLLFYGVPGTGKTLMAQAIADEMDMELKIVNTADIETSEPGGAERNIRKLFKEAAKKYDSKKPEVVLFDECDSLLTDRNEIGTILAAQVNALLTELERYKGVVIFTTNRLGKLDPALERRIAAKISFDFPNKEERLAIWQRMIPKKAPIDPDVDLGELADFPMTGGSIKNAVLNAARKAAYLKNATIHRKSFLESIEQELQGAQQFVAAYEQQAKLPRRTGGISRDATQGLTIDKVAAKDRHRGGSV